MFPSTHNSFVSKILPVTLFDPRFSKKFFPYPADCNRSPGEGWSTHLDLLRISCPPLSAHRRIMLAGEGARPTCGSPALRNGEYCYFHRRWRMTTVDLSHSAHHVTTEFVLPVLEDADSIQITLGQIMRMIVCRHQYSPLFTTKSSRSARAFTSGARDLAWICSGVDVHASQTEVVGGSNVKLDPRKIPHPAELRRISG